MTKHCGTAIIPTRVRTPTDKPKAEVTIGNIFTWITATELSVWKTATFQKCMYTQMSLYSIVPPKKPGTKPGKLYRSFENKHKQNFHTNRPNQK